MCLLGNGSFLMESGKRSVLIFCNIRLYAFHTRLNIDKSGRHRSTVETDFLKVNISLEFRAVKTSSISWWLESFDQGPHNSSSPIHLTTLPIN